MPKLSSFGRGKKFRPKKSLTSLLHAALSSCQAYDSTYDCDVRFSLGRSTLTTPTPLPVKTSLKFSTKCYQYRSMTSSLLAQFMEDKNTFSVCVSEREVSVYGR